MSHGKGSKEILPPSLWVSQLCRGDRAFWCWRKMAIKHPWKPIFLYDFGPVQQYTYVIGMKETFQTPKVFDDYKSLKNVRKYFHNRVKRSTQMVVASKNSSMYHLTQKRRQTHLSTTHLLKGWIGPPWNRLASCSRRLAWVPNIGNMPSSIRPMSRIGCIRQSWNVLHRKR